MECSPTCEGSVFGPLACEACDPLRAKEGLIGVGVGFERMRRITGYLSPTNRWNNAKRSELKDRVSHMEGFK